MVEVLKEVKVAEVHKVIPEEMQPQDLEVLKVVQPVPKAPKEEEVVKEVQEYKDHKVLRDLMLVVRILVLEVLKEQDLVLKDIKDHKDTLALQEDKD